MLTLGPRLAMLAMSDLAQWADAIPPAREVLFGLGLPALVGVVLLYLGRRPRSSLSSPSGVTVANAGPADRRAFEAGSAAAAALGIGFLLAFATTAGAPPWPPKEATQWLFVWTIGLLVLLPLGLLSPASPAWLRAAKLRRALSGFVLAGAIATIATPLIRQTWSTVESAEWCAGLWIGGVVLWAGLAWHAERSAGNCSAWAMAGILAMSSIALGLSGSQTYGQLAAALPAVWGPLALVATCTRTKLLGAATVPMLVVLYGGLLLCGQLYAELTPLNALLLAAAPLGLCLGDVGPLRRLRPWQRGLLGCVASMTPAAIATVLAVVKFLHDVTERSQAGY